MNFRSILENILLEASKLDILIDKMGVNQYNAESLAKIAGPLTIWLANKILEKYEEEYYSDSPDYKTKIIPKKNIKERMALVNGSNSFVKQREKVISIMDWFNVGLNGNIKEYYNLSFDDLYGKSHEWHESLGESGGSIDYTETNDVVIDLRKDGIGCYWVDLGESDCPEEAERMGHCARSRGTLYSLRSVAQIPGGNHTISRSHLTASIDDGRLIQLKGKKNSKPKDEYHQYIIPLLLSNLIDSFGSEYNSSNDFKISDLTDDQIFYLYKSKPELFKGRNEQKILIKLGHIEKTKIDPVFIIKIHPEDVKNYVTGDWTISRRTTKAGLSYSVGIMEKIVNGETWDTYDCSDVNRLDAIVYYADKEMEAKLWAMVKEFAQKDGIELDPNFSLADAIDELDNDEIDSAIRRAVCDCEEQSHAEYLEKTLRDCLEDYGEVLSMNDEGVQLRIDLDDIIEKNSVDDEQLDEFFDACDNSITPALCVFEELHSNDMLDKPDFDLDNRWSPDVDTAQFNSILNELLNEI